MSSTLVINGKEHALGGAEPDMPLLWFLRDQIQLLGTKYGCGLGLCGACTVHINGEAMRSCSLPIGTLSGKRITTVEGLSEAKKFTPLQKAWWDHDVAQCGYCQSGQLMSASALLAKTPRPTDADIDNAMAGNLCRCGTYTRIRKAIHSASSGATT